MSSFSAEYDSRELDRLFSRKSVSSGSSVRSRTRSSSSMRKVAANPGRPARKSSSTTAVALQRDNKELLRVDSEAGIPELSDEKERDEIPRLVPQLSGSVQAISKQLESNHITDHRPLAGFTGVEIYSCEASLFNVRIGPDYKKHGKKAPSLDSFYECVASDVVTNTVDSSTKVHHIAQHVRLPRSDGYDETCQLPRVVVVNAQVISKPPKLFGKQADDVGCSVVFYFTIKPETVVAAQDLGSASPALRLFHKFSNTWDSDESVRRRFKAMGQVGNVDELGLSSMLQRTLGSYNGKPAMIFKSGELYTGNQGDGNYLEIDIMIDKFALIAQRALCAMRESIPKMILRPAFVIQGESNDELPECLIGCVEVRNLNLDNAQQVCFPPL